jgi:hypothetical protein
MIQPETQIETSIEPLDEAALAVSEPFVGRWNLLISQTNWEKGRIIFEWRAALIESGAGATSYSDEAWARSVSTSDSDNISQATQVSIGATSWLPLIGMMPNCGLRGRSEAHGASLKCDVCDRKPRSPQEANPNAMKS